MPVTRSSRGRIFVLPLVALAVSAAAAEISGASTPSNARSQTGTERPNILVIVTDDQRATGTLGVMPKTRRFFHRNGTRFKNSFASTPLCCPSRGSIFSGRYAHNHGLVRASTDPSAFDQGATIQAHLSAAGYLAAISGKYLNSWDQSTNPPHFNRWSYFSRGLGNGSNGYYNLVFNVDGVQKPVERYSTHFVRDRALRYLSWFERRDDRPWFLYVAPFAPHGPAIPEKKYSRATVPSWRSSPAFFEEDVSDKPRYVQEAQVSRREIKKLRVRQLRSLKSVDDLVGDLFAKLSRLGEKGNTLAIFMSDNGFLWGEHGRSAKSVPYSSSVAIPMAVRWPGHVERGGIDARLASNIDIAPTVLHAADATVPQETQMDGRSMLDSSWTRDRILLEFWEREGDPVPRWASIRGSDYQYVEYYTDDTDRETVIEREYYDLTSDPWQLENLLADDENGNDPPHWMVEQLSADRRCSSSSCP